MLTAIPDPILVVLCGKTEAIETVTIESLKPDIEGCKMPPPQPKLSPSKNSTKTLTPEVIHLILTPAAGIVRILSLLLDLMGRAPAPWARTTMRIRPWAIICDTDADFEEMRSAVRHAAGAVAPHVPWMRPNVSRSGDVRGGLRGWVWGDCW
jgi:hypothetical protein